jgi:AcrR family transcriptional regulator
LSEKSKSTAHDPRFARNRLALRRALLKLLERHAFDDITARMITDEAGTGYATFFRHFPTKAAALEDLATHEIDRVVAETTRALYAADTQSAALTLCTYVDEHRAVWSALFNGGAASVMREEFIRISVHLTKKQSLRSDWLPAELAAIHNASANLEILAWWIRQPERLPIKQLATIIDRLVVTPVMASASNAGSAKKKSRPSHNKPQSQSASQEKISGKQSKTRKS